MSKRRWLLMIVLGLAVLSAMASCNLNPQPEPPGFESNEPTTYSGKGGASSNETDNTGGGSQSAGSGTNATGNSGMPPQNGAGGATAGLDGGTGEFDSDAAWSDQDANPNNVGDAGNKLDAQPDANVDFDADTDGSTHDAGAPTRRDASDDGEPEPDPTGSDAAHFPHFPG
jgi:hypothetical protein